MSYTFKIYCNTDQQFETFQGDIYNFPDAVCPVNASHSVDASTLGLDNRKPGYYDSSNPTTLVLDNSYAGNTQYVSRGPMGPVGPTGPPGTPAPTFQNMLYVAKNGNDTTKSPYSTIGAALTDAFDGVIVMVYPGIYTESEITIPFGVTLKGVAAHACILQYQAFTSTAMVRIGGENVKMENMNIEMTSSTEGIELDGIVCPFASFKMIQCSVKIENNSISDMYPVKYSGVGEESNLINCNLSVKSTGSNGTNRCLVNSGTGMYLESCRVSCQNGIGIETVGSSANVLLFDCIMDGTLADISQTAGNIRLSPSSVLMNKNANTYALNVMSVPLQMRWRTTETSTTSGYLVQGSTSTSFTPVENIVSFPMLVFGIYAYSPGNGSLQSGDSCTLTLLKNGTGTLLSTTLTYPYINSFYNSSSISFSVNDTFSISINASTSLWNNIEVVIHYL